MDILMNNISNSEYLFYLNNNILSYTNLNINNIEYSPLKKQYQSRSNVNDNFYSNIYYYTDDDDKRENFKFTTDYLEIKKFEKNSSNIYYITFDLSNDNKFVEFIKNLEKKVIDDFPNILNISNISNTSNNDIPININIYNNLQNPPTDINTMNENSNVSLTNENTHSYKFFKKQSVLYCNGNENSNSYELKCKIGNLEDLFVYDYSLNLIDNPERIEELINKKISVKANISCIGIWTLKKQFGLTWLCSQLQFNKNSLYIPKFIQDISSDDSE